jgi:hypothetical protein
MLPSFKKDRSLGHMQASFDIHPYEVPPMSRFQISFTPFLDFACTLISGMVCCLMEAVVEMYEQE